MNNAIISLKSVRRDYHGRTALEKLTFAIPEKSLFAIVGPDGAGKTTLLRILAGILQYDSGTVEIFGRDYRSDFDAIKAEIGYMPQRFGLYEDLTVAENIEFFADLFMVRKEERRKKIERLLQFSRLGPFTSRLAGKLSGGMKQKLGLTCALIHSPKILLLDEPTNGVDPVSRRDFWQLLYELNRDGTTIVISSSYMDEAERASHFALLRSGQLIEYGEPKKMQREFAASLYELSVENPRQVKSLLEKEALFPEVYLFGRQLHFTIDRQVTTEEIRRTLEQMRINSSSLRQISPSFEDIFLHLSRRS